VIKIEDYRDVAPRGAVDLLLRLAERVRGRRFIHVSVSRYGGGAAEIPQGIVPLLGDLGIESAWEIIGGDGEFFGAAKALDAALRGEDRVVTETALARYVLASRLNARKLQLEGDLIAVHDAPAAPLIVERGSAGRWVWRCHMDLSAPERWAWSFLSQYVARFDAAVFSHAMFAPRISIPQFIIHPSIDPLSDRNRALSRLEVRGILERLGVGDDKSYVLQVGLLDRYADPVATINAYRIVKKHHDVRLVLAGHVVAESPGGAEVAALVRDAAAHDGDILVLELPPEAQLQINALQRGATIVVQRSFRDRFGLEVAEAMWKGKPVVGEAGGGSGIQIIADVTGFVVDSVEGAAFRLRQLLANPETIARMGGAGREHVRRNFLITRHLADYVALLAHMTGQAS
jgi:trehalose synthase